ncbi:MAG: uracil-DNA glycosylase family protein [Thiohalobacterales bacterium]
MSHSYDPIVVKAFRGKPVQDVLKAAPDALKGVSAEDAQRLKQSFGVDTVRELAENPYFHRAMAVLAGAGVPRFDPGPPLDWEAFFAEAPLQHYQQFPEQFRLDFGPVYYRGRLDGSARVLIVGQDPSVNEILAHRIFVGRSGQRIQGFLKKLGVTRSYLMLNTFLYSVHGQFFSELENLSGQDPILSYRNAYLDRLVRNNPVEAVVAVGRGGQHAVANWPGRSGVPVVEMFHPSFRDEQRLLADWNAALQELHPVVEPDDGEQADPNPYGQSFSATDIQRIPTYDLPFGLPDWHGDGSHAQRDNTNGKKRIVWQAPEI